MSEDLDIPTLLRQVRRSVLKEKYDEAVRLYELIIQDPEMGALLDTKTRYAFCVEKTGNLPKAIALYQDIVEIYKDARETGAAKALELKISILQSLVDRKSFPHTIVDESDENIQNFEEASLAFMNYLDLSEEDLNPDVTPSQRKQEAAHDFMEFLSLGTQDFAPVEDDEETQEIQSVIENEKTQEIPSVIEDDELSSNDTREVVSGMDEIDENDLLHAAEVAISSVSEEETIDPLEEPEEPEEPEDLDKLKELIREGIKDNRVKMSDDPSIQMALTSIGNHKLELVDSDETYVPTSTTRTMELNTAKKAKQLFGKKKGK